jgi:Cu+-exporting ATPase
MNQQAIKIEGMSCASCVGRVEKVLAAVPGVDRVSVNLATEMARVESSQPLDLTALVQAVDKAGYQATPVVPEAPAGSAEMAGGAAVVAPARQRGLPGPRDGYAVLLAALLSLPLVLPMLLEAIGVHWMLDGRIQFLFATPVQFWLGARFYRAGWLALRARSGNMDLLVALGTSAAYGLSVYQLLAGGAMPHLYFEASAVVITLVLLGKWLEARAKRQTTVGDPGLQALRPDARRACGATAGIECRSRSGRGRPGGGASRRTHAGRRRGAEGASHVDESLITGESLPVARTVGER